MTRTVQKIWFSSRSLVLWYFQSIWRTCLCERTWKHLPSAVPPRSMLSPRTGQKISQTLSPKVHASLYVFFLCVVLLFSSLSLLSFTPPSLFSPPVGFFTRGVELGPCLPWAVEEENYWEEGHLTGVLLGRFVSAGSLQTPDLSVLPAEQASFTPRRGGRIPWMPHACCRDLQAVWVGSPKATWGLAGRVFITVQCTSAEICKIRADFLHTAWWCADYWNSYQLAHSRSSPSAASQERADIAPPILSCPEKASLTPLPPSPTINCATFACCRWRFLACSVPHAVPVALLWAPWQPRLCSLVQRVGSLEDKASPRSRGSALTSVLSTHSHRGRGFTTLHCIVLH